MDLPVPHELLLRQSSIDLPAIDDMKQAIEKACPIVFKHLKLIATRVNVHLIDDIFDCTFNLLCLTYNFKYAVVDDRFSFPPQFQETICSTIDYLIDNHIIERFIDWYPSETWYGSKFASLFNSMSGEGVLNDCKKRLRAISDDFVDIISPAGDKSLPIMQA